jgi:hypothetical protein
VVLHRSLLCTYHGVVQVVGGGGVLCFRCGILSGRFILLSDGARSCVGEHSVMSKDCAELVNLCFCRQETHKPLMMTL